VKSSIRIRFIGSALMGLMVVLWIASCAKAPTPPDVGKNKPPQTELTFAPIQFDTTTFRVHFYWNAFDDDGEVIRFHFATDDDTLLPPSQWHTTTSKDTTLLFLVDPIRELRVHVFKVAAEDNNGNIDPTPASRAFSAKTIPPTSQIEKGPSAFNPIIGPNFTFEWSGIDPDGGETGGKVPVDTFQYLLLQPGAAKIPGPDHPPLPTFDPNTYINLIRGAVGQALQAPYDDWTWVGIRALKNRFRNVSPGKYVFAERAVDIAGATEKNLLFVKNIRQFTVTNKNAGPLLVVRSSILNRPLDGARGPDDFARKQLQIFQGETVSFSWTADASDYGGEIVGFTYALDDTSSFPGLDIRQTGVTFQPSVLTPGPHVLYVRCMDDGGLVTNLVLPLLIVHPDFKDATATRDILFVDDSSTGPLGNGSGPPDDVETNWWTQRGNTSLDGPLLSLAVPFEEWDTIEKGLGGVEGRLQPDPKKLSGFSTVVWVTDATNGGSVQTGLFKTVAGGDYSELQGYLRAGGTLILTGWNLAQNTSGEGNLTYKTGGVAPNGICTTFAPGSREFDETVFPRMYMGIDNSLSNTSGLRSQGAFDFVRGIPTAFATSLGFDTARVDTGNFSFGVQFPSSDPTATTFKWNTNEFPAPFNADQQLFPGVAGIEAWIMARSFGCQAVQNFGLENPGQPVVQPLYTYHGVRMGPLQNGAPSPREGFPCASFVQSHDLATNGGHYVATAAVGRIALFTFPLYYLKDADAVDIMKRAFTYVNLSPTLP
jgi:hypothetical protein